MARDLYYGADARRNLCTGMEELSETVKSTYGPLGRTVVTKGGAVRRGSSVTKGFSLPDLAQDLGAQLLMQAVKSVGDAVGDGTATTTVLAQSLVREGRRVVAAGCSPVQLRRGLQGAAKVAVAELDASAQRLNGEEDARRVAVAACGDQELGASIAQAMEKVGLDGVITLKDSKTMQDSLEIVIGTQFDKGYLSPDLVKDQTRMESVMERPFILFTDDKIENLRDILPIMDQVAQRKAPLLVVAADVTGEALKAMIINQLKGTVNVMAVRAPGFGERQKALMDDLALLTGGTVIREKEGLSLREADIHLLGRAEQVTVNRERTLIQGGAGDPEALRERVELLRRQLAAAKDSFAEDRARERLGKLASGVAVLSLGAASELELREKRSRAEDALSALRSAVAEGIVPGGGAAYCAAIPAVEAYVRSLQGDEAVGAGILVQALKAPLAQIAENAGLDRSVVLNEVMERGAGVGLDVRTGEYVPMLEAGIADPVQVTKLALNSAVSMAATLLTIEVEVVDPHDEAWLRARGGNPLL